MSGRCALFRAELVRAALSYAGRGYPVFPVRGEGEFVVLPPSHQDPTDPNLMEYCWEWAHAAL